MFFKPMFFALLKFSLWLQNCNWWMKVLSIKSFIKRVILLPGFLQIKSFLFLSFIMVESKCLVKSFKWKFQTLCYCCNFHNYFHFFSSLFLMKGVFCLPSPSPPPLKKCHFLSFQIKMFFQNSVQYILYNNCTQ